MIHIREIDHIVLRALDMESMRHFYCAVLGCTVERREAASGLLQLRAGSALIDLVAVDGVLGRRGGAAPGTGGRNVDHFCLLVEPFDEAAIRAELAAAGVATEAAQRRYGAAGWGPSLYLSDPEGNTIELKGRGSPDA